MLTVDGYPQLSDIQLRLYKMTTETMVTTVMMLLILVIIRGNKAKCE